MSAQGQLARLGMTTDGYNVDFDGHLRVAGGIHAFPGRGKAIYCDPLNGSDTNNGRTPRTAVASLSTAYGKLTANQHDVLYLIGSGTGATISDQLEWSKSYTHLVGIAAPTPNSRARISSSGNSTSTNALLLISGDGCMFSNVRIYQGSATAACHAVEVTGDRNYFFNCNIQGQVNTTAAQGASSSLKLNGAEEFRFERCIIGQVTGAARTAGQVLVFDGSCGKGDFINCDFKSYSETAGAEIIGYVDANGVDREIIFRECFFYNFSVNHAATLSECVDMVSTPATHDLIFFNPTLVGIDEMESTGSAFVWVTGAAPAAGTAGSGQTGVAVNPS